ncbi:MAG: hypothetical protein ACRDF4_08150 [Rhabdochlamydiaceae bacterium]
MMESKTENQLSKILPKTANQLLGLRFGNRIDQLLGAGLNQKTLTYVYGKNANYLLNLLCGNAISTYEGHAIFFDAGNSFDPYLIVREYNLKNKDSQAAESLLKSIYLSRAFTCHQLVNLVTIKLKKITASDSRINTILVSGIDSVFSEEDSTKQEIEKLQFLIASALKEIATDKGNGVIYTIASSNKFCRDMLARSDVAIKLLQDKDGKDKALLAKHYAKQSASIEV